MSRLISEGRNLSTQDWARGDQPSLLEGRGSGSPALAWIVAGAVVVGLGYLAWTYVGPDLKRYLKVQSM
jgi:hypothetical protein